MLPNIIHNLEDLEGDSDEVEERKIACRKVSHKDSNAMFKDTEK